MTVNPKFKSAIKRGTGEAYLLMKSNPDIDFSNYIIKASFSNLSYDNQSEGSRAKYIFELIQLSKQKEKIRKAILKRLSTERKDTWALVQLFDLAALFAKNGDEESKKAIYKRFYKKTIQGSEWAGQRAIIELDGFKGLQYVMEIRGKIIKNNSEEWEDNSLINFFQEKNPTINVRKKLAEASKNNEYIKTYLDTVKRTIAQRPKHRKSKVNYHLVTERIAKNYIVPLPPLHAKKLSQKDIIKLADDFLRVLKEKDRIKLEKYMRVFDRVKYPYNYAPILTLAKSKNKKSDSLVEYASGALKYFSGNDIRKFALEILNKKGAPFEYLDLLVANYQKGDYKLLTNIIQRAKTEDEIHSLVYGYINIYKANKTKECKKPLEAMYDKLTCGIHRTDIVKILIENNLLSAKIKREIMFDSSDETRNLISKKR